MYRDDDEARDQRATALIGEIAHLERERLALAAADRRLEVARRELATLQPTADARPSQSPPGLVAHVVVFGAAACATFVGYSLLF